MRANYSLILQQPLEVYLSTILIVLTNIWVRNIVYSIEKSSIGRLKLPLFIAING
jgi:hypothetical protein